MSWLRDPEGLTNQDQAVVWKLGAGSLDFKPESENRESKPQAAVIFLTTHSHPTSRV